MHKKIIVHIFILFNAVCSSFIFAQETERSLSDIFIGLKDNVKNSAMSKNGFSASYSLKNKKFSVSEFSLRTFPNLKINILQDIYNKKPSYVLESLFIIPKTGHNTPLLDVYNALSQVHKLAGIKYNSATRGKSIDLFEEATRIESAKNYKEKKDPANLYRIPQTETIYLRVKDANFGACYYMAEMKTQDYGMFYTLSNFKALSYLIIPVIEAGNLCIKMYIEPIKEGILLYAVTGVEVGDFAASKVDIPSAIQKRLNVIYSWIIEGINKK
jgi:hypothetical protein